MTTPRLNRIFTVSGADTETVDRHIRWGYDERLLPEKGLIQFRGQWIAYGYRSAGADVQTAQRLIDFGITGAGFSAAPVSAGGRNQIDVLNPLAVLSREDEDHWLRLTTPDAGESNLQWTVSFVRQFWDDVFDLDLTDGQLVGDDFDMPPSAYVQVMLERHTAPQSVAAASLKVWGEIQERGSALGVLTFASDDPVSTGSEEQATAVVRYRPDIAIGLALTDDLGREWAIRGSRTLRDRRYLEYQLTRDVSAVG